MSNPPTSRARWLRINRWLWCAALAFASLVAIYVAFLLLGFVPINRGYQLPATDDRVRILIRSNEIHTDIVMPTVHDELGIDWRELFPPGHFAGSVDRSPYIAVGWGSRRFYVETPTWAEFKVRTAFGALFWPSESVLHVEYLPEPVPSESLHEIFITGQQYQELVRFVETSVGACDERGCAKIASEVTYGPTDHFYVSASRYHCFNTCNQWTGRGLARAGVPVGMWTPLKPQVLCWLPAFTDGVKERRSDGVKGRRRTVSLSLRLSVPLPLCHFRGAGSVAAPCNGVESCGGVVRRRSAAGGSRK